MSIQKLKNGADHDSYAVDAVIDDIAGVANTGIQGMLDLVDLKRVVTNHPKADRISEKSKQRLVEARLLNPDGTVPNIVRDVLLSATEGEDMGFIFSGQPYYSQSTAAERAGLSPESPAGQLLNMLTGPGGMG